MKGNRLSVPFSVVLTIALWKAWKEVETGGGNLTVRFAGDTVEFGKVSRYK